MYLHGYRDAVDDLAKGLSFSACPTEDAAFQFSDPTIYRDDARGTWGLHATGVLDSKFTGRGVRVAALVDGLDVTHPDWLGRSVVQKSFVPGESTHNIGQSGTHYLGTALGTAYPSTTPRYGCAPEAIPYVAKVLSASGTGSVDSVLAGINWAISNKCRIILAPVSGQASIYYEALAKRAASHGCLLVAGAGNNAQRPNSFGTVLYPAACPSVMGVGSIDGQLSLTNWTPRSSNLAGGEVDIVAPGMALRSSAPRPQLYQTWSGSATAAAYVAGIGALWAEALPNSNAHELWCAIVTHARPLPHLSLDMGAGLVQAP